MPSASMILARWTATVLALRERRSAMALLELPSTISCKISSSRGVRPESRSPFSEGARETSGARKISPGGAGGVAQPKAEIVGIFQDVAAGAGVESLAHQSVFRMHAEH